ncbi:MAG: hypothetical protein IAF08_17065 [Rhizobacter sp.]|nr:hypothetical protein [Chlorobiales bacterium]
MATTFATAAQAQVEWSGTADAEFSIGGKNSNFISNDIASDYRGAHFSIYQLNLFLFAPVNEEFSIIARVQFDTWGTGTLNAPRLTLASIVWQAAESPLSITAGRFISPFGLYARRQLQRDNLFASSPLLYGYFTNISDKRGLWPQAGSSGAYGRDDVGLSTLYFGGYATGVSVNYVFIPNQLALEVAVTNSALASQSDYTNLSNVAGVARLGFSPAPFWQQGVSVSYGGFMQRDAVNQFFGGLENYSQLAVGTDIILGYAFFELSGEAVYASWRVPRFSNNQFSATPQLELLTYTPANYAAYLDLKIELPFLIGSYVAFRYDKIGFFYYDDPLTGARAVWDNDVTRLSLAAGYKFTRNVLLKVAASTQTVRGAVSNESNLENYALRTLLTVSF